MGGARSISRPRALIAATLAVATLLVGSGESRAAHVSCGQALTVDTTLDSDVTCQFPSELAIGAAGITLDLNGHRLDGPLRNQGFDDVRIVNGVIAQRVELEGVSRNEVRDVDLDGGAIRLLDSDTSTFLRIRGLADSESFLTIAGSAGNTVSDGARLSIGMSGVGNRAERMRDSDFDLFGPDSSVTDSDNGSVTIQGFGVGDSGTGNEVSGNRQMTVFLWMAQGNRIIGNSIASDEGAIFGDTTSGNVIRGNVITTEGAEPQFIGAISLLRSTSDVIENNYVSGPNTGPGTDEALRPAAIWVNQGTGTRIAGNHLSDRTRGIQLTGSTESTIADNVITGVTDAGIFVYASDRNEVSGNRVTRAGEHGIEVTSLSNDNRVERNTVIHNAVDGITVLDAGAAGNLLTWNVARANGDDGIGVDQPGTTLSRNHAIRNFDWGIEAVDGTIDGGGNRASANGQRAQCLNVRCRR